MTQALPTKALTQRQTVNRLRKVRNYIAERVSDSQLDMQHYLTARGDNETAKRIRACLNVPVKDAAQPACGTVCCIAGWTAICLGNRKDLLNSVTMPAYAQELLGLSNVIRTMLFTGQWPGGRDIFGKYSMTKAEVLHGLDMLIAGKGEKFVTPEGQAA